MDLTIFITIGNDCVLGLDEQDHLILVRTKQGILDRIDLGPFTKRRIKDINYALERLSIHIKE